MNSEVYVIHHSRGKSDTDFYQESAILNCTYSCIKGLSASFVKHIKKTTNSHNKKDKETHTSKDSSNNSNNSIAEYETVGNISSNNNNSNTDSNEVKKERKENKNDLFLIVLERIFLVKKEVDDFYFYEYLKSMKFDINNSLEIVNKAIQDTRSKLIEECPEIIENNNDFILQNFSYFSDIITTLISIRPQELFREIKDAILNQWEANRRDLKEYFKKIESDHKNNTISSNISPNVIQFLINKKKKFTKILNEMTREILFSLSRLYYGMDYYSLFISSLNFKLYYAIMSYVITEDDDIPNQDLSAKDKSKQGKILHVLDHIIDLSKGFFIYMNNNQKEIGGELGGFNSMSKFVLNNFVQLIPKCQGIKDPNIIPKFSSPSLFQQSIKKNLFKLYAAKIKTDNESHLWRMFRLFYHSKFIFWKSTLFALTDKKFTNYICRICEKKIPLDEIFMHVNYCNEQNIYYERIVHIKSKFRKRLENLECYLVKLNQGLLAPDSNILNKTKGNLYELLKRFPIYKETNNEYKGEHFLKSLIKIYKYESYKPVDYYEQNPQKLDYLTSLIYLTLVIYIYIQMSNESDSELSDIFGGMFSDMLQKMIGAFFLFYFQKYKSKCTFIITKQRNKKEKKKDNNNNNGNFQNNQKEKNANTSQDVSPICKDNNRLVYSSSRESNTFSALMNKYKANLSLNNLKSNKTPHFKNSKNNLNQNTYSRKNYILNLLEKNRKPTTRSKSPKEKIYKKKREFSCTKLRFANINNSCILNEKEREKFGIRNKSATSLFGKERAINYSKGYLNSFKYKFNYNIESQRNMIPKAPDINVSFSENFNSNNIQEKNEDQSTFLNDSSNNDNFISSESESIKKLESLINEDQKVSNINSINTNLNNINPKTQKINKTAVKRKNSAEAGGAILNQKKGFRAGKTKSLFGSNQVKRSDSLNIPKENKISTKSLSINDGSKDFMDEKKNTNEYNYEIFDEEDEEDKNEIYNNFINAINLKEEQIKKEKELNEIDNNKIFDSNQNINEEMRENFADLYSNLFNIDPESRKKITDDKITIVYKELLNGIDEEIIQNYLPQMQKPQNDNNKIKNIIKKEEIAINDQTLSNEDNLNTSFANYNENSRDISNDNINNIKKVSNDNIDKDQATIIHMENFSSKNIDILNRRNPNPKKTIKTSSFKLIIGIAKGGYGSVGLYRKVSTGDNYAIKKVDINYIKEKKMSSTLTNERIILNEIKSEYVVIPYFIFKDSKNYYFVMEYLPGGDVLDLISKVVLKESTIQLIVAETILAVRYLHSIGIVHHDIKPENILISQEGHFKLGDFGLSKTLKDNGEFDMENNLNDFQEFKEFDSRNISKAFIDDEEDNAVGTLNYMAPELFTDKYPPGGKIDYWSIGIIIYELYTYQLPFSAETTKETTENIINNKINWSYIMADNIKETYKNIDAGIDLIQKFLDTNPKQRWGDQEFEKIKSHQFFKGFNWNEIRKIRDRHILLYLKKKIDESNEKIKKVNKKNRESNYNVKNNGNDANNDNVIMPEDYPLLINVSLTENEEKSNYTERLDNLNKKNNELIQKKFKKKEYEINENQFNLFLDLE